MIIKPRAANYKDLAVRPQKLYKSDNRLYSPCPNCIYIGEDKNWHIFICTNHYNHLFGFNGEISKHPIFYISASCIGGWNDLYHEAYNQNDQSAIGYGYRLAKEKGLI